MQPIATRTNGASETEVSDSIAVCYVTLQVQACFIKVCLLPLLLSLLVYSGGRTR